MYRYGRKYVGIWSSHSYVVHPQTFATNLEAQYHLGCVNVVHYNFTSLELNRFQQNNNPVHKASSIKTGFSKIEVEELRTLTSTPLNTYEMNWNADYMPGLLTKALVAE